MLESLPWYVRFKYYQGKHMFLLDDETLGIMCGLSVVNFSSIHSILYLHCMMVILWFSISFLYSNHPMGIGMHPKVRKLDLWMKNWLHISLTPVFLSFLSYVGQREEIVTTKIS